MIKTKTSGLIATALLTATLLASPLALAGHHGEGKPAKDEMCQQYRDGTGKFSKEAREARMEKRAQARAAMADRLKLTDEQRAIWQQIHDERKAEWADRKGDWKARMDKRCGTAAAPEAASE